MDGDYIVLNGDITMTTFTDLFQKILIFFEKKPVSTLIDGIGLTGITDVTKLCPVGHGEASLKETCA